MSLFLRAPDRQSVSLSALTDIPAVPQITHFTSLFFFWLIMLFHSDILGRSCQSPAPDEQAESGAAIHKSSVLPQQAENPSRVCTEIQGI